MRASLLASATTTMFLCARASSPRTHRPSGVSRSTKVRQHGSRTVDEVLTQISIAALADAEQARFAARRHLPWRQSEPGRHVSPARGRSRASPTAAASAVALIVPIPGIVDQPPHGFVFPRHADELRIKGRNPLVEGTPFARRSSIRTADARAQRLDHVLSAKTAQVPLPACVGPAARRSRAPAAVPADD